MLFLSTSGPISHILTLCDKFNFEMCMHKEQEKEVTVHFYHGLSCDLEQKNNKMKRNENNDNYNNININNEIKSYNKTAEFKKIYLL